MATERQHRRGTTAQHESFIGAAGEVTVDTDLKTARVHDGSTAGGEPLARMKDVTGLVAVKPTVRLDFANNKYTVYDGITNSFGEVAYSTALTHDRNSEQSGINAVGAMATAAANQPAMVFDPATGESLGVQHYEERTNRFTYSGDMSQADWTKLDAAATTATKIIPDTGVTGAAQQSESFTADKTETVWAVFEAAEHSSARIQVNGTVFNSGVALRADFDLSAETATVSVDPTGGTATAKITLDEGTARYQCEVTFTPEITTSTSVLFWDYETGDGSSGLYCHRRQIEVGDFPSPYIATTTSQVTRLADEIYRTLDSNDYNPNEGTIVVLGLNAPVESATANRGLVAIDNDDGAIDDSLFVYRGTNGAHSFVLRNSAGTTVASAYGAGPTGAQNLAISWDATEMIWAANGQSGSEVVSGSLPSPASPTLRIGNHTTGAINPHGGTYQEVRVYPKKLTASELEDLTR